MSLIFKIYKKPHPFLPPTIASAVEVVYACCLHFLILLFSVPSKKAPDPATSRLLFLLWSPKIATSFSQWPFSVFIPLDTLILSSRTFLVLHSWSLLDFSAGLPSSTQPSNQGFLTLVPLTFGAVGIFVVVSVLFIGEWAISLASTH